MCQQPVSDQLGVSYLGSWSPSAIASGFNRKLMSREAANRTTCRLALTVTQGTEAKRPDKEKTLWELSCKPRGHQGRPCVMQG